MSDLFQRLAQQASGQGTPSVRSAARVQAEPFGVMARGERVAEPSLELEQWITVPGELGGPTPDVRRTGNSIGPASVMMVGRAATAQPTTDEPAALLNEPPMQVRGAAPEAEPRLPLPLLDWHQGPTAPATESVARVELGASTAREIEPTEVHVHIGRIEITAEKAPPPRSKPASTRQPMALRDYLAKRQRSAR